MSDCIKNGRKEFTGSKIKLLVSDIDGTLVPADKQLTRETIEAAIALEKAGIKLCLVSSRPPQGIKSYFEALNITTPYAALNGGEIISFEEEILSNMAMDSEDAKSICQLLNQNQINVWIFGGFDWSVFTLDDPFVAREMSLVGETPRVIENLDQYATRITKIEGVSKDTALLDRVAEKINRFYPQRVRALRSSPTYLDLTHPKANKGFAAKELGRLLQIDISETACIGDMDNDIPMLEIAGLSIAMRQSSKHVCQHAHVQTKSNEENGWAYAVYNYVIPRA
ncbi:Sugar phosphatase YidA [Commensalibacter sp. Nvir]|uniref:HAD family hydrolase n=1 Tax=Commensalibacter sp. Nvir TaxID=3069817 RepID=UPI002D2C4E90|nr:Sugar phosphatase YidA [Commensalibacter sp. Nvir]